MGEVVQFIPERDLDRARLIQEARAIYEGIFPTAEVGSIVCHGPVDDPKGGWGLSIFSAKDQTEVERLTAAEADRDCNIEPPASPNAIMRRAYPRKTRNVH
jgi:hypothetical protein